MPKHSWKIGAVAVVAVAVGTTPAWATPATPASPTATPKASPTAASSPAPPTTPTASSSTSTAPGTAPSATGDNPAVGGVGQLGQGVVKQPAPAQPGTVKSGSGGSLSEATQRDLGYDQDEFNRRSEAATTAAQANADLRDDPGFSYAYTTADGRAVIVGQGAAVTQEAAKVGATVDAAAFDPAAPTLSAVWSALKQQVGMYGVSSVGYGSNGYVIVVDPGAQTSPGKKSPEDFARQFKHVTVQRQAMATQAATAQQGGNGYNFSLGTCSLGFNGYDSDGAEITTSAGHCFRGGTGYAVSPFNSGAMGTATWAQWGGGIHGTDLSVITSNGAYSLPPEVNGYGSGTVTITGISAVSSGMPVCKSGWRTGWTCGTVDYTGWIWVAMDTLSNGSWVWSGATQNVNMYYGDSGGAWVSGHKAVGNSSAVYDNISYKDPVYRSTFSLASDYEQYKHGLEVKAAIGYSQTLNGVGRDGVHNLAQNTPITGFMPPMSGDFWSPNTMMHIRIPSSGQDFSVPVNPDGSYSFTYTGPSGQPYIWTQAYYGRSVGGVAEFNRGTQIDAKYAALGGSNSALGATAGDEGCGLRDGGCWRPYRNGAIYWSPLSGAWSVHGAIWDRYSAIGRENSALGYPISDEVCGAVSGVMGDTGCYEQFQNGYIFWSPNTGPWEMLGGPIRQGFEARGVERGSLGYPMGATQCGLRDGGCMQAFEGGFLTWSPNTGAHVVSNPILTRWAAIAKWDGQLGYPTSDVACNDPSGVSGTPGCYQGFQGGFVFSHPSAGTWEVFGGAIRDRWGQLGVERGSLGYPTGAPGCSTEGCWQPFEGGWIMAQNGAPAHEMPLNVRTRYGQLGAEHGALGWPTGNPVCGVTSGASGKTGCYEMFQHGFIFWSPTTGTWEQYGPIRSAYEANGVEAGRYGFPTGPQARNGNTWTQSYEGGTLTAQA